MIHLKEKNYNAWKWAQIYANSSILDMSTESVMVGLRSRECQQIVQAEFTTPFRVESVQFYSNECDWTGSPQGWLVSRPRHIGVTGEKMQEFLLALGAQAERLGDFDPLQQCRTKYRRPNQPLITATEIDGAMEEVNHCDELSVARLAGFCTKGRGTAIFL